ncbi:hypothetical protein DERP_012154 [Dermatophagoides pteronyssinus]|uniref:Secreted protein n=1 Tax=Dermatophagoides pteronyssinus TaxID=6956 RepID=A0ABQ8J2C5_DERPT|nr:hypothetical protein DERP_012154 [Dermatophagoides pteronyssinus]
MFVFFHFHHFLCLKFCCTIVVDDTDTTTELYEQNNNQNLIIIYPYQSILLTAIAMAISDSVTVSIGDDTSGVLS